MKAVVRDGNVYEFRSEREVRAHEYPVQLWLGPHGPGIGEFHTLLPVANAVEALAAQDSYDRAYAAAYARLDGMIHAVRIMAAYTAAAAAVRETPLDDAFRGFGYAGTQEALQRLV